MRVCVCVCVCLSSLFLCVLLRALLPEIKAWLIDWLIDCKGVMDGNALEMASPANQHCVNCIGTLSFPMRCCMTQVGLSLSTQRARPFEPCSQAEVAVCVAWWCAINWTVRPADTDCEQTLHRLTSFSVTAVTRVVADIANQHRPAAGKRSRRSSVVDLLNASVVLDLFEGVWQPQTVRLMEKLFRVF